jgi:hypothetical protein
MKSKYFIYLVLIIIFCCISIFGEVHDIDLAPGRKMTFTGAVTSGEGVEQLYIFQAKAGQKLTVEIKSINAVFSVNEQYRVDHSPIEVNGEPVENRTTAWSGVLPETESHGLYSVSVTSGKTARYTLEITLGSGKTIVPVAATDQSPQGVIDFYRLMPQRYDGSTVAERNEILALTETFVDEKHGYIGSTIGTLGERCQVAIFKKPVGGYVLAYNEDGDLEAAVKTKFFLLDYQNNKWTDVTAALMPVPVSAYYSYDLPRAGTTIKVTNAKGTKLYSLAWRGGRFVKI